MFAAQRHRSGDIQRACASGQILDIREEHDRGHSGTGKILPPVLFSCIYI